MTTVSKSVIAARAARRRLVALANQRLIKRAEEECARKVEEKKSDACCTEGAPECPLCDELASTVYDADKSDANLCCGDRMMHDAIKEGNLEGAMRQYRCEMGGLAVLVLTILLGAIAVVLITKYPMHATAQESSPSNAFMTQLNRLERQLDVKHSELSRCTQQLDGFESRIASAISVLNGTDLYTVAAQENSAVIDKLKARTAAFTKAVHELSSSK